MLSTKIDGTPTVNPDLLERTRCAHCGEVHGIVRYMRCFAEFPVNSDKYFTIYGNVAVGINGGIIGNNFNSEGKLEKASIVCYDCFVQYLRPTINEEDKDGKG
jgi:hypothetical protein